MFFFIINIILLPSSAIEWGEEVIFCSAAVSILKRPKGSSLFQLVWLQPHLATQVRKSIKVKAASITLTAGIAVVWKSRASVKNEEKLYFRALQRVFKFSDETLFVLFGYIKLCSPMNFQDFGQIIFPGFFFFFFFTQVQHQKMNSLRNVGYIICKCDVVWFIMIFKHVWYFTTQIFVKYLIL